MNPGEPGGFNIEKNQINKNSSKLFTLAGFMIDANKILEIENSVKDIKLKYGLSPIHEVKWHTTYSKLSLNFEQYKNMKMDIIKIISHYPSSVIGIVVDKDNAYKNKDYVQNHNDLYAVALHLLMERVSMQITEENNKNDIIPAMVIADSRKNDNNNKLDKELQIAYLRAKNM